MSNSSLKFSRSQRNDSWGLLGGGGRVGWLVVRGESARVNCAIKAILSNFLVKIYSAELRNGNFF